jgi:ATP-dependent DNA helicase RecG
LGIYTLRDLLFYFPRRYDDYSKLKPINRLGYREQVTVIGTVKNISTQPIRGGKLQRTEAIITDGSGSLRVNWFNQPYLARRLHTGMQVSLSGKTEQYLGRLIMNNPDWEALEQQQLSTNRIVPIYRLSAQISAKWLRRVMSQGITSYAHRVCDHLPQWVRRKTSLVDLPTALTQIHFPDTDETLERAKNRLSFDEILLLQLGVLQQKRTWQDREARIFKVEDPWLEQMLEALPFKLTGAQLKVLQDIRADLESGKPMNRLVQGDVGSGKTVIAALGIALVARSGSQAAIMAPTGILAEQHYKNMLRLLTTPVQDKNPEDESDITISEAPLSAEQICLLVGATPEEEKQRIRNELQTGKIKLVVGTHALIEDPILFQDLQMVVVDEQHRFGVEQRAALRAKGENVHLLVMTATPIPRTLALTIYGDLDLSTINELPAGRQPVSTFLLPPSNRERAYSLIRSQIDEGRQAFIIYPLVEESENSESMAAVEEYSRLQQEIFPKHNLGLLHGRLKPDEKERVMADFQCGKHHILVSTSVIEVGVDVPNATVMLIEGANRFGLAQLHQFRGRVGRGSDQSYCLLIPESADDLDNERLKVLTETNDGFLLAEKDLEQRGPGQFLGTRQSGYSEFQLANLTKIEIIEQAQRLAHELISQDPELAHNEHTLLAQAVKTSWTPHKADIS